MSLVRTLLYRREAGILVMMGASCMIVMMVGVFIHRGRS